MLRKGLTGLQTIALAIDSSIKTLTISITGNPERAILYTPSGIYIILYKEKFRIRAYRRRKSDSNHQQVILEVHMTNSHIICDLT